MKYFYDEKKNRLRNETENPLALYETCLSSFHNKIYKQMFTFT